MLAKKILAAVGLAGALVLGVAGSAEARPGFGGGFHRGPVFHHGPVYGGGFRGPVYRPVVYRPVYRGADWRRLEWERMEWRRLHGYRW